MATQSPLALKPLDIRNKVIPLPSRDDGYATVMLVGTTGAGKTTVLRQFIGSERFPPTSTSRTTTCDIEIVTGDGPFNAVVTFMDEQEVRSEIETCLHNAFRATINERARTAGTARVDNRIASALLSPRDQRFRLSYPLGRWSPGGASRQRDFGEEVQTVLNEYEAVSETEKIDNQETLGNFVAKIKEVSALVKQQIESSGLKIEDDQGSSDREAWMDLFHENLETDARFHELVENILAEIRDRFDLVQTGKFTLDENGWPLAWQYYSDDRDTFLTEVRWFSSNHSEQFGRLLTPLVNGVRVRGQFAPADIRLQTERKLVIVDGEGLGHRAQTATSVRSEITSRFPQVDVILLVDNAQQPMLAAPQELVKAVGSSGYADKLAFAFTHFENVTGDDLYTDEDRKDRVRLPGEDAVAAMQNIVGEDVADALLGRLESYTFFLENMDRPTDRLPGSSIAELRRLLDAIEEAAHPEMEKAVARIQLSSRDLDMAIGDAVKQFHEPWQGWLGIKALPKYPKEHWARVKALTARVKDGQNGYDTLLPVADLHSRLQEGVSRWLDRQATTLDDVTPEERQAALTEIRQRVRAPLQSAAVDRIARQHRAAWERAYNHRGPGSSRHRASEIEAIYNRAAPTVGFDKSADAQELLNRVYAVIQTAAEEVDGRLD